MKKIIAVFIFIFSFVLFPAHTLAQTESILGWAPVCLEVTQCGDDERGGRKDNDNCPGGNHWSNDWTHRSRIHMSRETFPANAELLVTECIHAGEDLNGDGVDDPVCTTADTVLDRTLFCGDPNDTREICDHKGILGRKKSYTIYPPDNTDYGIHYLNPANDTYETKRPFVIQVGADGKSPHPEIEWQAWTPGNETRRYIAWYKVTEVPTPTIGATDSPTPVITGQGQGSLGGQQQATLTFPTTGAVTTAPSPTPGPPAENCPTVQYDPYGMAFDIKTLEPIPDVMVQLRQKNPQGIFDTAYANERNLLIGGANPFPTGNNGQFTFFVEDGEYSLYPVIAEYTHPDVSTQSTLHPNTQFVYSDFYFNDSPPIVQQGRIEHRDIPLMPTNGTGKTYELKVMQEDFAPQPNGSVKYTGLVSHPYAQLTTEVCEEADGTETCANATVYDRTNGGPGRDGRFTVTLDQSVLQPGQYYKRSFEKVDLTLVQLSTNWLDIIKRWFVSLITPPAVFAEEVKTSAKLSPIVQYLEGYAYDSTGKLMPNAQVNIFIDLSELPIYQTTANSEGYYRITSEYLPKMLYQIGYSSIGTTTVPMKITTAQFLAQNKAFVEAENIDPYTAVTALSNPRRTVTPSFAPPLETSIVPSVSAVSAPVSNTNMTPPPALPQQNNTMYLVGAILLLLVAAAATLIGVYMYKKKSAKNNL